ncbi:hypothetical protein Tco_0830601, partial [Tanacetum coccineum]
MSTQQDIYAAGSENRPPMLNKENYVPWSSRLLRYAKSRPNGKLIYNSIMNGPYVRRMRIPEPGDTDREVPVPATFHEQTDDELTVAEIKQMEADDQAIQTILLGLPEDIYAAVDSCETAQESVTCATNDEKEVDDQRAERLAKTHDPLALMANSNNPYNYLVFHQDQPSSSTYMQTTHNRINNNYNPQPSFNQNYMQQPMPNPEDITDPTTAMNMALVLMANGIQTKLLQHRTNTTKNFTSNPLRQYAWAECWVQNEYNAEQNVGKSGCFKTSSESGCQNSRNQNGQNWCSIRMVNGNVVAARAEGNSNGINGNPIRCIAQNEEAGIQLTSKEFDFIAAVGACEETEKVTANCNLQNNLQLASTSGTQSDKAPVYESDGSTEVHLSENCYGNDIFNMFTQEEHVEQGGGTVEQHSATIGETHAYHESLFHNIAAEVEKVNSVNYKLRETNANLTTELARYKNQEKCFEISQEKYDKLERCYQKSVYQKQCLTKKINAIHLSSAKTITTLNEEISNLNKQLSKEKSTVSSLQEEKKRLKSDFKIRKDDLLDKQIQLENKIKELDNILVKTGQSIQTMHMLSPKPDSFYHTEQKMALGYQNPFYLKQAQQKQQSLYNGKVLLEKHDRLAVYDSEETLQLAQESRIHKIVKDEIFPIINQVNARVQNFEIQFLKEAKKIIRDFKSLAKEADESLAKHKALELEIERLLRAVVSQDIMSTVQNNSVVDTSNLKTELERTKECFENCIIKKENEYAKLWNDWFLNKRTPPKPNAFQSERLKFSKTRVPQKVDKTNDISNPVTSNSVSTPIESKVVENDNVIAPGMFRIDPCTTSREDKFVPINKVRASIRTNPITASQPHVITKKIVNSDSNGFSSTGVDITTKTRRPQPRSNTKNNRVSSASNSSRIKNKEVKVEEHHRNLLLSKNKKYMSFECYNIKLAICNDKYEVICAMCKQCLITANHDVCVLNYVNGMNSRGKKHKANVSNIANQTKHMPQVKKPKKVGFTERLASPKPSKPRMCLRWSPTYSFNEECGMEVILQGPYNETLVEKACANCEIVPCEQFDIELQVMDLEATNGRDWGE